MRTTTKTSHFYIDLICKQTLLKIFVLSIVWSISLLITGCAIYTPLGDSELYQGPMIAPSQEGVSITFLGNSTLYLTDGKTKLLVDGFVSRPGPIKTLFGKLEPNVDIIRDVLEKSKIDSIDAILVGHAHHDHALDAPFIAKCKGAKVMGSTSYRYIHEGNGGNLEPDSFKLVTGEGRSEKFGDFVVTFRKSKHVCPHFLPQHFVKGEIAKPLKFPAHFSCFKHGEVYTIHIHHTTHGSIIITTTAGADNDQYSDLTADIAFLGIGTFGKESQDNQKLYWDKNITNTGVHTIIPIHWDSFSRPLSKGLSPPFYGKTRKAFEFIDQYSTEKTVFVMDVYDSILLKEHKILRTLIPTEK